MYYKISKSILRVYAIIFKILIFRILGVYDISKEFMDFAFN